jgi:DNA-binding transcriptional LysR family regulator
MPDELARSLTIAIVPGVNPGKWTKTWSERHPRTRLEVLPISDAEQHDVLTSGRADMVFARMPVDTTSLHAIRLYDEVTVVVAERDHPISVVDAVSLVELDDETVLSEPLSQIVDLIVAGGGVTVVPQSVARQFSRKDLVVRPVTDAPPSTVALVWPRSVESAAISEFIGIVRGRTARSSRSG